MSWSVEVIRDGEVVVNIGDACRSGRDLDEPSAELVRQCAHCLLAFVGPRKKPIDAKYTGENLRRKAAVANIEGRKHKVTVITHVRNDMWIVSGKTLPNRPLNQFTGERRMVVHRGALQLTKNPPVSQVRAEEPQ